MIIREFIPVLCATSILFTFLACQKKSFVDRSGASHLEGNERNAGDSIKEDSIKVFKETLYPLLVMHCAQCHQANANPLFASEDSKQAHDSLILAGKVDFTNSKESRIYKRMKVDAHNCNTSCEQWGDEFDKQIVAWSQRRSSPTSDKKTSPQLMIKDLQSQEFSDDPLTFVFEAESGSLTNSTSVSNTDVPGASGGKYIAGRGNQSLPDKNGPLNSAGASTSFTVNVSQSGEYYAWARVNVTSDRADEAVFNFYQSSTPAAADQKIMRFPNTGISKWAWIPMQTAFSRTSLTSPEIAVAGAFQVAQAGTFTLQMKTIERVAASSSTTSAIDMLIDKVAISADPFFRGNDSVLVLRFDVSELVHKQDTFLEIEVDPEFSSQSYELSNPRIICSQHIHIAGLRVLLNGLDPSGNSAFSDIDEEVEAPGKILSAASMPLLKGDATTDKISISFEIIE